MVRAAMSAAARTLGPRSESDLILPFDSLPQHVKKRHL